MNHIKIFLLLLTVSLFISCDKNELPGEGSITDETPPEANFSFEQNAGDWMQIDFANLSLSATDYTWDFGDGATATLADPSHTYAAEGTYSVSLIATDKLNQTSTFTDRVVVVEPIVPFTPEILNPGFDIEGADDYRDNWRNGDLGDAIQITSSPIHEGVKAAKLPDSNDRIGYQLLTVEPNADYTVSFYYTMKTSPVGTLTVSILAGAVTDPSTIPAVTINSVTLNDQSSASTFVPASVSFNSGNNTEVAIYFTNVDVECRLDTFTIVAE